MRTRPSGDVVPLPDYLKDCGCRHAPSSHVTTCAMAIAFDDVPLLQRPEYVPGKRFAAISWDFPLTITGEVHVSVDLDPVAIITANRREYDAFELENGYEDWEKPMVFLSKMIEDQLDDVFVHIGGPRMSHDSSYTEMSEETPRWLPEHTEALNAALNIFVVDPNQTALEI